MDRRRPRRPAPEQAGETPAVHNEHGYVYVLGSIRADDRRTYVGWCVDLDQRLAAHNVDVQAFFVIVPVRIAECGLGSALLGDGELLRRQAL